MVVPVGGMVRVTLLNGCAATAAVNIPRAIVVDFIAGFEIRPGAQAILSLFAWMMERFAVWSSLDPGWCARTFGVGCSKSGDWIREWIVETPER